MNTKNNQRFKGTEQTIRNAFLELLGEQSLDRVTVGDICKKANVNRSTFYAHHDSAASLLEKMDADMSRQLTELFKAAENEEGPYHDRYLMPYLLFLQEHKAFYRAYFRNSETYNFKHDLLSFARMAILHRLKNISEDPERVELTLTYYTAGIYALIREWVMRDSALSPAELADVLRHAVADANL